MSGLSLRTLAVSVMAAALLFAQPGKAQTPDHTGFYCGECRNINQCAGLFFAP